MILHSNRKFTKIGYLCNILMYDLSVWCPCHVLLGKAVFKEERTVLTKHTVHDTVSFDDSCRSMVNKSNCRGRNE